MSATKSGKMANWGIMFPPLISQDGRFVAFNSQSAALAPPGEQSDHVYVWDRLAPSGQNLELVDTAGGGIGSDGANTFLKSMSGDGRFIVFISDASNLVPSTDNRRFVFIKDRQSGALSPIALPLLPGWSSHDELLTDAAAISTDGSTLAAVSLDRSQPFERYRAGFVRDLHGRHWQQYCGPSYECGSHALVTAPDGSSVGYSDYATLSSPLGAYVFVRAPGSHVTLASPGEGYQVDTMQYSGDGKLLMVNWKVEDPTFHAAAVFYRTTDWKVVDTVRFRGLGGVFGLDQTVIRLGISYGRTGVVDFDRPLDAAIYDRGTKALTVLSKTRSGVFGNGRSIAGQLSADGRSVTIATDAWNLVTGDHRPDFPNQGTDVLLAVAR